MLGRVPRTLTSLALITLSSLGAQGQGLSLGEDWTVLTMAGDGSWGVGTGISAGPAIAAAIRNCRSTTVAPSDCGAQLATTRGGWIIAKLCGNQRIMATAETLEDAERAVLNREIALKRSYAPHMPPCRRLLTVDPKGGTHPSAIDPFLHVSPVQTD
jgi:hypothetical protein